jgi:hypothetical protein
VFWTGETVPIDKKLETLLTIEQTSGCLSSHAYSYLIPFASSIKFGAHLPAM